MKYSPRNSFDSLDQNDSPADTGSRMIGDLADNTQTGFLHLGQQHNDYEESSTSSLPSKALQFQTDGSQNEQHENIQVTNQINGGTSGLGREVKNSQVLTEQQRSGQTENEPINKLNYDSSSSGGLDYKLIPSSQDIMTLLNATYGQAQDKSKNLIGSALQEAQKQAQKIRKEIRKLRLGDKNQLYEQRNNANQSMTTNQQRSLQKDVVLMTVESEDNDFLEMMQVSDGFKLAVNSIKGVDEEEKKRFLDIEEEKISQTESYLNKYRGQQKQGMMNNHRMSIAGMYEVQLKDYQDWIKQCIETFRGFDTQGNEKVAELEKALEEWITGDQFNKIKRVVKEINSDEDSEISLTVTEDTEGAEDFLLDDQHINMMSEIVPTKEHHTGDIADSSIDKKGTTYSRIDNSFTKKAMIPYNKNTLFEQKDSLVNKNQLRQMMVLSQDRALQKEEQETKKVVVRKIELKRQIPKTFVRRLTLMRIQVPNMDYYDMPNFKPKNFDQNIVKTVIKLQRFFRHRYFIYLKRLEQKSEEKRQEDFRYNKLEKRQQLIFEIYHAPKDRFGNLKGNDQLTMSFQKFYKDHWAGYMLSYHPKVFENLRLVSIEDILDELQDSKDLRQTQASNTLEQFYCRNCSREIEQNPEYKFWFDNNLGFFCQFCLVPAYGGIFHYIKGVRKCSINHVPEFVGIDLLKDNCITYNNRLKPKLPGIGFADKDKRESTNYILPQKWQWLINERENILKPNELIQVRPKVKRNGYNEYEKSQAERGETIKQFMHSEEFRLQTEVNQKMDNCSLDYKLRLQRTQANIITHRFLDLAFEITRGIYDTEDAMKQDLKKKFFAMRYRFNPLDTLLEKQIKKADLKSLVQDKEICNHFTGHPPLVFIRSTFTLGFLNWNDHKFNGEPMTIEPFHSPQFVTLFPCSNIYKTKACPTKFKQFFSVCFFISARTNESFKNESQIYKNRGFIQVFEIEASWQEPMFENTKSSLKVVGQKMILNVSINEAEDMHQNFDVDGNIDGIRVFDNLSQKVLELKRPLPFEYTMISNISYCRYQKFFKHQQNYKEPIYMKRQSISANLEGPKRFKKIQILVVEAHLTSQAQEKLFQYQQFMALNNCMQVLLNMVPYNARNFEQDFKESQMFDKSKTFESQFQKKALDFLIKFYNPLQPLAALGGRCISPFLLHYSNNDFDKLWDQHNSIKRHQKPSLIAQIFQDQPKFQTNTGDKILGGLILPTTEMSFDLDFRNSIHDAIDAKTGNLHKARRFLEFVVHSSNDSRVSRNILSGLMHQILTSDDQMLKQDYSFFFTESDDQGHNISKFGVKMDNMSELKKYSFSRHFNQVSNISSLNPDHQILQKLIAKEQASRHDEHEISDKKEHYSVDFRHVFLQARAQKYIFDSLCQQDQSKSVNCGLNDIDKVFDVFSEQEGFQTTLETTEIMHTIYSEYGDQIEKMRFLKELIGNQFDHSKKLMTTLAITYLLFFCLPFILQVYSKNTAVIIVCLVLQLLTQIILLSIEMLQLKTMGREEYFNDTWNWIELGQTVQFLVYFIMRCIDTGYIIPIFQITESKVPAGRLLLVSKKGDVGQDEDYFSKNIKIDENVTDWISFWVIFNSTMVIQMIFKLMYFLRINAELSKLVKLIKQVFYDVAAFTLFLFGWVFVFVLFYQIAGIQLGQQSQSPYKGVAGEVALFIQSFRNSFGDVQDPQYDFWISKDVDFYKSTRSFFIHWAWILFIFHEFFLLIVLLNFLIAIVSQSYDNIMDKEEVEKHKSRIYMNIEAAVIIDYIRMLKLVKAEPSQIFHAISDFESINDNSDQFQGFVRTMKNEFSKKVVLLKDFINHQTQKTQHSQTQLQKDMESMIRSVQRENRVAVAELKDQISQIGDQLKSMNICKGDPETDSEQSNIAALFRQTTQNKLKSFSDATASPDKRAKKDKNESNFSQAKDELKKTGSGANMQKNASATQEKDKSKKQVSFKVNNE